MSDYYPDISWFPTDQDPYVHHCEIRCPDCGTFVSNRQFPEHECDPEVRAAFVATGFDPDTELAEFLDTPEGKFANWRAGRS